MSDIFVSYKAEDRSRVRRLVEALQADSFSVWWDEQIGGGAAWRHAIEAELNAAKCVIVIWSKRSVGPEGEFVHDEAVRAKARNVYIPVTIDNVHLPLGFGETQALPLTGWRGHRSDPRYKALLNSVRRLTGRQQQEPASGIDRPRVDRRTVLGAGAIGAAAVAGVGGWALLKGSSATTASIAVLPFANLSGDPAQQYFSDGIADEIRSALARLGRLTVISSTSSEAVRNDDAKTAAKKLGVANILTGNVRKSPSTVRISAELIDGNSGADRWTQDYDRSPGDAIKIQTDIAENVARALSAALGGVGQAGIVVGTTRNPEAQRLYLQVEAETKVLPEKAALQHAIQLLNSATTLDPNYADAYALKAQLLISYGNNYIGNPQLLARSRAEALRAAQTALRIAPDVSAGHRALFSVYSNNLQFAPAYAEIRRAVELVPEDADLLVTYAGFISATLGQSRRALGLIDHAIRSDPLNPRPYTERLTALLDAREYQGVVAYGEKLEVEQGKLFSRAMTIALALILLGRRKEAQRYLDEGAPDYWERLTGEALMLARSGERAAVTAKVQELYKVAGDAGNYQYGQIFAQLGEKDRAFLSLDRAFANKDAGLTAVRTDPFLDPLRADPRFGALLSKMNFPS